MLRVGVLTPHSSAGADVEFEHLAGDQVSVRVARTSGPPSGEAAPSLDDLRALTRPETIERAAAELEPDSLDALAYASTSSAYVIGPDAERDLLDRLREQWSVPACSTSLSAVAALRRFDVRRLALVHPPWFGHELNATGAAYFRSQGFVVVQAELADVVNDSDRVQTDEVVDWVSENVSADADAVFIGGNGFRAARAVPDIEAHLGCLALESNQVLLWSLLSETGAAIDVQVGKLFDREDDACLECS